MQTLKSSTSLKWSGFRLPGGEGLRLHKELEALAAREIQLRDNRLRELQKACRRLMNNAEENRDYLTADIFHCWSVDALRKESWSRLGLIRRT
jgi:hypothetical protein